MSRFTFWLKAMAAIAIVTFVVATSVVAQAHGRSWMGDFRAFYCAAHVRLTGADPYAAAPLFACETQPVPPPFFRPAPGTALPAPVPGYLVAAFAPFALLPFIPATIIWVLFSIAAFVGTIILLQRLGLSDIWTLLVMFALPVVAVSLPIGELPPVALFGIVLSAWAAVRGHPVLLGLGILFSFSEPQVGVGVALAAIALSKRFALVACVALTSLLILSLATLGLAENVAYVRDVLPAHELSELPAMVQYSLSWVLDRFGASGGLALSLGHLSWILMLATAFVTARLPFGRRHPDFAILAAPAFAVVGGPFLHLDHIALALPAALWLCAWKNRSFSWIVAGLVCLAVPLLYVFVMMPIFGGVITASILAVPLVAGWIVVAYTGRAIDGVRVAAAATVYALLTGFVLEKIGTGAGMLIHVHGISSGLAQATWSRYVRKNFVFGSWTIWLVKIPTWFGVVTIAAGSLFTAIRERATLRELQQTNATKVRPLTVANDPAEL